MWKWIGQNRLLAGGIVLLLIIASASAADGYRTRQLLKQAQTNLEDAQKEKEKALKEAEREFGGKMAAADRKLAPVLRERDSLKAKLARLEESAAVPFVLPTGDEEIVARFQALGYKVRVIR